MAYVSDETLSELSSELKNFKRAKGNRDYEASLLAGAVQEVLDQAHWDQHDEPPVLTQPCTRLRVLQV